MGKPAEPGSGMTTMEAAAPTDLVSVPLANAALGAACHQVRARALGSIAEFKSLLSRLAAVQWGLSLLICEMGYKYSVPR